MKFVSAFSTGKDSMLALHRMVKAGHEPMALIVMYNKNEERSWFHGASEELLASISDALGIPVVRGESDGYDYDTVMENILKDMKEKGAEACVFGDIDIENHRKWDEDRCRNAGIEAILPLWNESREDLVREVVSEGYRCVIKCLHPEQLPESFLGRELSSEVLEEMKEHGIDLCGENGEYHTVVLGGPLFREDINYKKGRIMQLEYVSAIELTAERK